METSSTKTILFILLLLVGKVELYKRITFNRSLTGIDFYPYAQGRDLKEQLPANFFTADNVRTMLEVVSTKFSRIFINSVDAHSNAPFIEDASQYYEANVRARTAEIAAKINRERNGLSLRIMIGIFYRDWASSKKMSLEMKIALEAAEKAHSIYPDTVEGLFMSNYDVDSLQWANKTIQDIQTLRNMSKVPGIKIGTRQFCDLIRQTSSEELFELKKEIFRYSDFVICGSVPLKTYREKHGAILSFNGISSKLLGNRRLIKSFNREIEVMHLTNWPKSENNIRNDTIELKNYWATVNKFAIKNNYPVWLRASFESQNESNMAWWILPHQELINNVSGYVETVSGMSVALTSQSLPQFNTTLKTWIAKVNEGNKSQSRVDTALKTLNARVFVESGNQTQVNTTLKTPKAKVNEENEKQPSVNNSLNSSKANVNETKEAGPNFSNTYYKLFGIALFAVLIVALIATAIACYVRKKVNSFQSTILTRQEIEEFRLGILGNDAVDNTYDENVSNLNALQKPYDRRLEISKENLEILRSQVLGRGEFGCVYKAFLKTGNGLEKEVALKMTRLDGGVTALKGLLSEIKILSYLGQHPNIVSIVGAYTAEVKAGTVYMATELCPLGSLRSCLKKCGDAIKLSEISTAPIGDMVRWSHEIACGMEYLEQMGVIHADLATRNVLLSSESVAKIADFGLSRRLYEYTNYTKTKQEPLPWRWMAVESLKHSDFSIKSDVWSYGVTLWEIFSLGCQPYPGLTWTVEFVETLEDGFRLKKPRYATQGIFDIMKNCWNLDKNARPTFTTLKLSTIHIHDVTLNESYTSLTECLAVNKLGEH